MPEDLSAVPVDASEQDLLDAMPIEEKPIDKSPSRLRHGCRIFLTGMGIIASSMAMDVDNTPRGTYPPFDGVRRAVSQVMGTPNAEANVLHVLSDIFRAGERVQRNKDVSSGADAVDAVQRGMEDMQRKRWETIRANLEKLDGDLRGYEIRDVYAGTANFQNVRVENGELRGKIVFTGRSGPDKRDAVQRTVDAQTVLATPYNDRLAVKDASKSGTDAPGRPVGRLFVCPREGIAFVQEELAANDKLFKTVSEDMPKLTTLSNAMGLSEYVPPAPGWWNKHGVEDAFRRTEKFSRDQGIRYEGIRAIDILRPVQDGWEVLAWQRERDEPVNMTLRSQDVLVTSGNPKLFFERSSGNWYCAVRDPGFQASFTGEFTSPVPYSVASRQFDTQDIQFMSEKRADQYRVRGMEVQTVQVFQSAVLDAVADPEHIVFHVVSGQNGFGTRKPHSRVTGRYDTTQQIELRGLVRSAPDSLEVYDERSKTLYVPIADLEPERFERRVASIPQRLPLWEKQNRSGFDGTVATPRADGRRAGIPATEMETERDRR